MDDASFVNAYEKELTPLAKAVVEGKKEKIAGAAAALFVKYTIGSSILAGVAEEAAAKAFGRWFADNATTRLQKSAAEFDAQDEQKRKREEFASWLRPQIVQAIESVKQSPDLNEEAYFELFGQTLRGLADLKERFDKVDDDHDKQIELLERIASSGRVQQPSKKHTCLYGAPRGRSTVFVGREEDLKSLEDLLANQSYVRLAASIEGLAGIGKTELALQLAYKLEHGDKFPGGIYWIDASEPDLTPIWGTTISDDHGGIPEGPIAERSNALLKKISSIKEPLLVVLDNVEAWGGDATPGPLPQGAHVRFLITTRKKDLAGTRFHHFDIGVLNSPYDRELVTRIAERVQLSGLEQLLGYLGGHALALELAGAFLRKYKTWTAHKYLDELQAQGSVVEMKVSNRVRYEKTVDQSLKTVWDHLDENLRNAWCIASWFAPEFATPDLGNAAGLDEDIRVDLEEFHLIEIASDGRWRMHRLTQSFGRRINTEKEQLDYRKRFLQGCVEHSRSIDLATGFRIYTPDRFHFDTALEQIADLDGEQASLLQDKIGAAFYSLGYFEQARKLREQALASDLKNLGEEHPSVAASRSNLALVLQDLEHRSV
jgi:tetratricopeptide (TPR) repeat protein